MLRTTPRILLFVLIAAAIALAPYEASRIRAHTAASTPLTRPAALAQGGEHPVAAAAGLPVGLELVVIVEDLASLRKTDEGRALAGLLKAAGLAQPLDESWAMLAERLGLTPPEAVDRLLGRRVVLAIRDGQAGERQAEGRRRWTLLSEIDDATAELLRANLDVAPRTVVKGQQVYAVEGGNLDLALHRAEDGRVTLLLGPSDAPGLLNDLILAVVTPLPDAETMMRSPVLDESRRLGDADVVVLGRVDPPPDLARPDAPHWDNFLVLNLRREAAPAAAESAIGGFSASIILRDASAWDRLTGLGAWSDAPVRAAGSEALAAIVEATPPTTSVPDAAGPLRAILSNVAPPPEISDRVTGRRALFILPRQPVGAEVEATAGLRIAVAAELTDLSAAAPDVDRFIAERIGDVERLLGSTAPPPAVFPGAPLRAARVEPFRLPENNPIEQIVGGRPVLAWTFRPGLPPFQRGAARGLPLAEGEKLRAARDRGWCVLTLSADDQSPAATAQHAADLLTAPADAVKGGPKRWLSIGQIQPAAVLDPLRTLPWLGPLARIADHVDQVEWRLELTDLLDVEGEATIRLSEPAAR